jgi:hypothetical protein
LGIDQLDTGVDYSFESAGKLIPADSIPQEKSIMKLAVRIFALSVVFTGVAAASISSSTTHVIGSRLSATASLPIPQCGPNMPLCPPASGGGLKQQQPR